MGGMQPTSKFVTVNGLSLHYLEWGKAGMPVVVCVHGYTSSAQAFNALARHLQDRFYIVAMAPARSSSVPLCWPRPQLHLRGCRQKSTDIIADFTNADCGACVRPRYRGLPCFAAHGVAPHGGADRNTDSDNSNVSAAADELAITVIEQRPILNATGPLPLDIGAELLSDLGGGEFAAGINERRDGGIAPQFHRKRQILDLPWRPHKALGSESSGFRHDRHREWLYRPPAYSCASQRYRRKWDRQFESGFLQRRVCEPPVPLQG
jgi:hypothetical protein